MKLLGRLPLTVAAALVRPTLAVEDASTCRFHVLPTDLDINLHMNNGRFLQIMDLGRVDWLLRTGIAQNAFRHQRRLVLGGVMTRYLRELRLFQSYTLTTRLIGWSRTAFYLQHRFEDADGRLVAVGTARATAMGRQGPVLAATVAADHWRYRSPELPAYVAAWDRAERTMHAAARREQRAEAEAETTVDVMTATTPVTAPQTVVPAGIAEPELTLHT